MSYTTEENKAIEAAGAAADAVTDVAERALRKTARAIEIAGPDLAMQCADMARKIVRTNAAWSVEAFAKVATEMASKTVIKAINKAFAEAFAEELVAKAAEADKTASTARALTMAAKKMSR